MDSALEVSRKFFAKDLIVANVLSLFLLHHRCKLTLVELRHSHVDSVIVFKEGFEGLFGFHILYGCDPLICVPFMLAFHFCFRWISFGHSKDDVCLTNLYKFIFSLIELHPFVTLKHEGVLLIQLRASILFDIVLFHFLNLI